ncbi:MAG: right-handed parallel beta-helix repeat-containing protein [Candidatus Sungbacteria bacterium]|nr:right-handed parallel beta-helix repeat-containing protein [Candidatus Sungbacteria bacterium]
MEDFRFVKLIDAIFVLGTLFGIPILVFAYDDLTTHPALTQEIVKFFNLHYPELRINENDTKFIIQGSIDEDSGTRWMHHFYDPIYEKGLSFGTGWMSSKKWAQDTKAQAGLLDSAFAGTLKSFFGQKGDYSWDNAVYEYAWGSQQKSLEALGHTLHLIEDASVPDHTRDDPHPPILDLGSPYEFWAKRFDLNSLNLSERLRDSKPIPLDDLNTHFDILAQYSNKNFFSKDTILSKRYSKPTVEDYRIVKLSDGISWKFGVKSVDGKIYKLVKLPEEFEWRKSVGEEAEQKYSITDKDDLILNDYWSLLSKQAVLHGAGVVKLFFDEVEKERKSKILYEKNRSWLAKKVDRSKDAIFVFASALYGITVTKEDLEGVEPKDEPPPPSLPKPIVRDEPVKPIVSDSPPPEPRAAPPVVPEKPQATSTLPRIPVRNPEDPPPLGRFIGGGGGPAQTQTPSTSGTGSTAQSTTVTSDITSPNAPTITSPASGTSASTTSLTFTGTAEASAVISATGFTATATADSSGDWSLTLTLGQGTTTLQFFATDASNNQSQATEHTLFVDSAAPDVTLVTSGCSTTVAASGCLLTNTSISLTWSSQATDLASYSVECETGGTACPGFTAPDANATSTTFTGVDGTIYTFRTTAIDVLGNRTMDTETVSVFTRPVVINEVAWAGTSATQSEDEWIELYNRTSLPISLSNWILYSETDLKPYLSLSGTIASSSYYLIERTNDTTTSVTADLIAAFGSGSGQGLSNGGEVLTLSYASTTIDSASLCSSAWCGGNSTSYATMERYDPDTVSSDTTNWGSNTGFVKNGTNADSVTLNGTPKARNSLNYRVTQPNTNTLSASRTLRSGASPYLITAETTVATGTTLTVEPGVVIKILDQLIVNGIVDANGTAESPIVITAYEDDEYGGDLNGDNSSTSPVPSSWKRLTINSPGSVFNNVRVRYGGQPYGSGVESQTMFLLNGNAATISNSTFEFFNTAGIFLSNSNAIISSNIIQAGTTTPAGGVQPTGIYGGGASPQISGNTIRNNATGLRLSSDAGTATVSSNAFTGNTEGAIRLTGNSIGTVLSGNTASGNSPHNGIIMEGTVTQSISLSGNLPYAGTFTTQGAVTMNTGTTLKGATLTAGTVSIQGTAAAPVVLTALADDAYGGDTDGNGNNAALCASDPNNIACPTRTSGSRIALSGGAGTSTVEYAVFRFGGTPDNGTQGAIKLDGGTGATFSNTTFEHGHLGLQVMSGNANIAEFSSGMVSDNVYGISSGGSLTLSNTVFRNNTTALQASGTFIDGGGNDIDSSNTTATDPAGLVP